MYSILEFNNSALSFYICFKMNQMGSINYIFLLLRIRFLTAVIIYIINMNFHKTSDGILSARNLYLLINFFVFIRKSSIRCTPLDPQENMNNNVTVTTFHLFSM